MNQITKLFSDQVLKELTMDLIGGEDGTVVLYTPTFDRISYRGDMGQYGSLWDYLVGLPGAQPSKTSRTIQYPSGARLMVITNSTYPQSMYGIVVRRLYIAAGHSEWLRCPAEPIVSTRLFRQHSGAPKLYFSNFWNPTPVDFSETGFPTTYHKLQDMIFKLTNLGAQVSMVYVHDIVMVEVKWNLSRHGYGKQDIECKRDRLHELIEALIVVERRLTESVSKDCKSTT